VNIIEKLEELCAKYGDHSEYFGHQIKDDLRAIVEEYKATEQEPVASIIFNDDEEYTCMPVGREVFKLEPNIEHNLFTHPPLSDETVKDASRYRWLRDVANVGSHHPMVCEDSFNLCIELINGIELDIRVDEAMKAEKE
jgi:hypothetical protein